MALLTVSPLAAAAAADPIAAIDAKLRAGEWTAAHELALAQLDIARGSLYPSYLSAVAARLAVAEAGLGRGEDAVWHWQAAQNLDRDPLSPETLASFGEAGAVLAGHRLRRLGEQPIGTTVYRAEDPGRGLRLPRKLSGDPPTLSAIVSRLPVPKAFRVEAVIDVEGRLREPVVVGGGAPGVVWEGLEAIRGWRYDPALERGKPVAVFHDVRFNAPPRRPLAEVVTLDARAAAAESLLRSGRWDAAGRKARSAWIAALHDREPRRDLLAATLAMRGLADAGAGRRRAGVCRWQAAQHLDDRLYGADLTAYGPAGAFLDGHRWGVAAEPGMAKDAPARVKRARRVEGGALPARAQGVTFLAVTVDERGDLVQPLILGKRPLSTPDESALAFRYAAGPLDVTWLGALMALDAVCDWTFEPARVAGKPVSSEAVMTVPVGAVPIRIGTGAIPEGGNRAAGGPNGWAIIDNSRPPLDVFTGGPP